MESWLRDFVKLSFKYILAGVCFLPWAVLYEGIEQDQWFIFVPIAAAAMSTAWFAWRYIDTPDPVQAPRTIILRSIDSPVPTQTTGDVVYVRPEMRTYIGPYQIETNSVSAASLVRM